MSRVDHKNTRCKVCGSDVTYVQSNGTQSWFKDRNNSGDWIGGWLCNRCYNANKRKLPDSYQDVMKRLNKLSKNEKMSRRKCCECGNVETYIYNNVPQWFKYMDDNRCWDGVSHLCHRCYKNRSDGYGNTIKTMAKMRLNTISLDRFKDLSARELGFIGEDIVSTKLCVTNHNIGSNNFNSPFDIYHIKYGRIDVKIRSLTDGKWEFSSGKNCDTHVLIGMDNLVPWEDVERVYIIPDGEMCVTGITITKCVESVWDKFLVDVKDYNDIYHDKYYLPYKNIVDPR